MRPIDAFLSPNFSMFQSTHPRGVRRLMAYGFLVLVLVSIHAPTRGATDNVSRKIRKTEVSIHAPTRGATFCLLLIHFLNAVSIHAPTRGATYRCLLVAKLLDVSIHAPTRGATPYGLWLPRTCSCFNPRTHEGCD